PELLARPAGRRGVVETAFPAEDKFDHMPARRAPDARLGEASARLAPSAFLTVQEGCDKFCAFCVVPYTRGAELSRPAERILAEARALVGQGVREITLLGQNVNAWHGAEGGLAALVRELAGIEGLDRIRYTTSHPNDMDDALIAAHGAEPKLMPFLHLPVQSGSDRVLKAMNRKHRADDYLRLVARLRASRPDLALSSDFIVGFPGETEDDFAATLALVEEVRFAAAYSFAYSSRPGTPAAERPGVDPAVAHDRLLRLQAVIARQQREAQDATVGRVLPVLLEKPGRLPGQMTGKSEHLMAVSVFAPETLRGQVVPVRVTAALTNSLAGQLA
ncbi:MAG TPA: MiaB/RimO family radical SAM methylthiotransferase, partial [Rubellimicrobium sp.]|nr:MiaB/RimO family radical SAM methylthiotransferase [Rubellimicrobium sp.]